MGKTSEESGKPCTCGAAARGAQHDLACVAASPTGTRDGAAGQRTGSAKPIFSWNTTKTSEGFAWKVYEVVPLKTPNAQGHYAESVVLKTGTSPTRAQATGIAQRWTKYLRAGGVRRSAAELAQGYSRWKDAIIGRLLVEKARDLSDPEIERALTPCVCGPRLVEVAKAMRDCGVLTLASLEAARGAIPGV